MVEATVDAEVVTSVIRRETRAAREEATARSALDAAPSPPAAATLVEASSAPPPSAPASSAGRDAALGFAAVLVLFGVLLGIKKRFF